MTPDLSTNSAGPRTNSPSLSRTRLAGTLCIVAAAVFLRLWAVAAFPARPAADAADYHGVATRLAAGKGYVSAAGSPTAWRPPGYPVLLAIVYSAGEPEPKLAYRIQAVLGGLTVALIVWLARSILGWPVALLSGLLATTYSGFVWLPRVLLSENLALPLVLLGLCSSVMLGRTGSAVWGLAAGSAFALACLTRPATLFAVPLVAGGLWLDSRRRQNGLPGVKGLITAALAFCICLSPWLWRNWAVFGRVPVLTTQLGLTLYGSYWPPLVEGQRIWGNLPGVDDPAIAAATVSGSEAEVSERLLQTTKCRLLRDPWLFLRLAPEKLLGLVVPFDWEWFPRREAAGRSLNVGYVLMLPLALLGANRALRRPLASCWPLWVLPMAVILQAVVFYGSPRFRLTAEPSLVILASLGIWEIWHCFRASQSLSGE